MKTPDAFGAEHTKPVEPLKPGSREEKSTKGQDSPPSREKRRPPGKIPRKDNPKLVERAKKVYYLCRFSNFSYAAAWRAVSPGTTARGDSCSRLGRKDYLFFEEHFKDDVKLAQEASGVDFHRFFRKLSDLLEAQRPVLKAGVAESDAKGELVMVPDLNIQTRNLALTADVLKLRTQEVEVAELPTMIIVKVPIIEKDPGGFN